MNDIAIRVEGLSKRYRIGQRDRYYTLRDTLANAFIAPFRWLKDISNFERRMSNLADPQSGLGNSQSPIQNSSSGIADSQFAIRNSQSYDSQSEIRNLQSELANSPSAIRHPQFIWALKDVSFEVKRGEVVGIIGRNGAGKSTLLKILSRITKPTEGEAEVLGRVGSLLEVGTGFHPELTGRENIYLNGAILGMRHAEIDRQFDEIVAFAEVEKFIDTPVKRYSSGMFMRLAFSVAAHLEPEILLVDEVLAVGDIAFQKKCLGKMGEVAETGRTVLFVSHNMAAIRSLCGSGVWLDNGQLVKSGAVDDVVGEYVEAQMGLSDSSSCVVERPPETKKSLSFYISQVEIQNEKGERTSLFEYNDTLVLIVTLSGEALMKQYGISFYINNEFGHLVSVGSSGAYHGVYFSRNTRKIRIEVGPLLLTSGRYAVSLVIYHGEGPAVIRADRWDSACSFTIHSQPFRPGRDISSSKEGVCIIQQKFSAIAE